MARKKSLYLEKEKFFSSCKYEKFKAAAASDFYRDLFPENTFEARLGWHAEYPKTNKGNGVLVYTEKSIKTDKTFKRTKLVFDDLKELKKFQENECAFISPIAYFGKERTAANARLLFALVFDLDEVGYEELDNFFGYHLYQKHYPRPTYVVNSGGGVHLYYILKTPLTMIPKNQERIKKIKYALTKMMWNEDTSRLKEIQYQGINQGFRLVGSKTKKGETVTAWKTGEKIDVEEFINYIDKDLQEEFKINETKLSLDEAKKKYPEWYHQRIELKRNRMSWTCKRDLYNWWKRRAKNIVVHHRYFYIMSLAIYAQKCGISEEELKKDAYGFLDLMNRIAPENPFTEDDVNSALEMYQECYRSFPRDEIARITAFDIPKNKRNGRTRKENLEIARFIRDMNQKKKGTKWNGRKSYQKAVFQFLDMNPNARAEEFCEITNMSRRVFFKYKAEWKKQNESKN